MNAHMHSARRFTALSLSAVLLATPLLLAQGRGGGGGGGGTPGPAPLPTNRMGVMTMGLTLTDDQKKQVKTIFDTEYKNAAPLRDQLVKSRLALGTAIQTKKLQAELDDATAKYAEQAAAMAQAESKALAKVMKLLTEEQRGNQQAMQWVLSMNRGIFAGKKWDTTPDNRFY